MESKVTAVFTSFNRLDLLKVTIDTFNKMNTYPLKEVIIIDDSALPSVHKQLKRDYPDYKLILNETNIGLLPSIDKAFAEVTTPFVFHSEDDFIYIKPGFIEPSIKILESNSWIMQVWLSNRHKEPMDPVDLVLGDIKYDMVSIHGMCNFWHGFTFIASLRNMVAYEDSKPWAQWSKRSDPLAVQECEVGRELFRRGYRGACLKGIPYCEHTGAERTTWR